LISGEDLLRRPDLNPCELVDGRIVPRCPAGFLHGQIEAELGMRLHAYARETGRGEVAGGEVGIFIRRNPDTVRAADILYISKDRLAQSSSSSGYLSIAPELVVEILSPDDRLSETMEKLGDYFSAGVERVWVVDPRLHRVFAYRSPTQVEQFGAEEVLRDEELLPGFACSVGELFSK
jgi:Uma2 family endonuclease